MGKIAKIVPLPRGEYSDGITYNSLDIVRKDDTIWMCVEDGTRNEVPEEGNSKWMLLIHDGRDGHDGGGARVDDNNVTDYSVYSSKKVEELLENVPVDVDDDFSDTSVNPVQNKVITEKISDINEALLKDSLDISNMSSAISTLTESISGINATISDIDTEIIDISANVGTVAIDVDGIKEDMGTLKFKIEDGVAKYSKDDGVSWVNFRNPIGTAVSSNVLIGKTFANSTSDTVNGSMANNGAWSSTITEKDGSVTIPKGYHNGQGSVTATYSSNSYGCFKIGELSGASATINVAEACQNIYNNYGISIDPNTLTNDNFIVSSDANVSTGWTPSPRMSSNISNYEIGTQTALTYIGASVSYTNPNLVVTNACAMSESRACIRHSDWTDYREERSSGYYYATSKVYLVLMP